MLNMDVRKEKFKMYEKDAKYTNAQSILVSWLRMVIPTLTVGTAFALLIGACYLDGSADGFKRFLSIVLGGAGMGVFFATLVFAVMILIGASRQKGSTVNSPEECTDELVRKLTADAMMVNGRFTKIMPTVLLSSVYSIRGDDVSAVKVLLDFNRNIFYDNPFAADQFYSLLVGVYAESGDLASAEAAYTEGEYFIKTYVNSPTLRGIAVKGATSHLECLRGNYSEAVRLGNECLDMYRKMIIKHRKKPSLLRHVLAEGLAWQSRAYAGSGRIAEAQACLDEAAVLPHTPAAEKLIHNAETAIAKAKSAD